MFIALQKSTHSFDVSCKAQGRIPIGSRGNVQNGGRVRKLLYHRYVHYWDTWHSVSVVPDIACQGYVAWRISGTLALVRPRQNGHCPSLSKATATWRAQLKVFGRTKALLCHCLWSAKARTLCGLAQSGHTERRAASVLCSVILCVRVL